jgi:hypothetical protein
MDVFNCFAAIEWDILEVSLFVLHGGTGGVYGILVIGFVHAGLCGSFFLGGASGLYI